MSETWIPPFPRPRGTVTDAVSPAGRGIRAAVARARKKNATSTIARWGKGLTLLCVATWAAGPVIGFQKAFLVVTVAGFVTAIIGLARPAIGLIGVGMLCAVDSISRALLLTGGLWRWNSFNYWLLIVMLLSLPFLLRLRDRQTRLLQLFILVMVLGLAFSPGQRVGVQDVLNVITAFGLLIYVSRAPRTGEVWYWTAIVCGCLAGGGGLVYFLDKESVLEINPNAWSFFPLTALFTITLAFSLTRVRRGRLALALLAAVNTAWVFLSTSRGSFLIAIVCLAFIVLQMWKTGGALPMVAAGILIAFGVASQFIGEQSEATHRFGKLLDSRYSWTTRTSGRSDLALGGWMMFQQHPLGIGTGAFANAWMDMSLTRRERLSVFREGVYTPAHSGWIKVLSENGAPGILLFSSFVLSFAVIGWIRRRQGLFLLGLLVTVCLSVAFLADEFQGKGLWLLAVVVMTVFRRAAARRIETRRPETGGAVPPPPKVIRRGNADLVIASASGAASGTGPRGRQPGRRSPGFGS